MICPRAGGSRRLTMELELELGTGVSPELTKFEEGLEPGATKTPDVDPNGNGVERIPEPATAGGFLLRSSDTHTST